MVDFHVSALKESLTSKNTDQVSQDALVARAAEVKNVEAKETVTQDRSVEQATDPATVQEAVNQMNNVASSFNNGLKFSYEGEGGSKNLVVKVTNKSTGDLVRSIPSQEFLDMKDAIAHNLGIIFNQEG